MRKIILIVFLALSLLEISTGVYFLWGYYNANTLGIANLGPTWSALTTHWLTVALGSLALGFITAATTYLLLKRRRAGVWFAFLSIIVFPILMQSVMKLVPPTVVNSPRFIEIDTPSLADEARDSIKKCGQLPDDETLKIEREHYRMMSLRVWSPDCKYIAWSVWESGTSWPSGLSDIEGRGPYPHEGVFLYENSTGKVEKIYALEEEGETPEFLGWIDNNTLQFSIYDKILTYNLNSKTVSP